MFSKACHYAIRAVILIAKESREGNRMSLVEIAERTGSPKAFTAKILQQLAREGILESSRGPGGGFDMPPMKAKRVKLSMVVNAIDGDAVYMGCGMGLPHCGSKNPCPLHNEFQKVRTELRAMLEGTDIHGLSQALDNGRAVLKG